MIFRFGLFALFISSLFSSETDKKTICLNMIVKNEKDVIKRCLDSALPLFDTWVIVDTGSTDGTQEVIKEHLKNIPGTLYERPWVNFGHNRQEALLLAKSKADYILFMDADDILSFSEDFKRPPLTSAFYSIMSCVQDNETWFQRLVRSDLNWYWDGVIHEDLFCATSCSGEALRGVKYIYLHDGARAKDPNTALNDIEILKAEIEKDADNPRNYFYLARSYIVSNQIEKALEVYKKRSQMEGNPEELFNAMLTTGLLEGMLGYDPKIVEKSLFKAYCFRSHRAEPLYYLAINSCRQGDFEKGYHLLHQALRLPSDLMDCMWIEKWIYQYGLLAKLAHCAEETGRLDEGIEICTKLLKRSDLPDEIKTECANRYESLHKKNIAQVQEAVRSLLERQ